jgi:cytochrome c
MMKTLHFAIALMAAAHALAADAEKGKAVFYQCSYCHNFETDDVKSGPSLKGLFSRVALMNGKPVTEANVLALILEGYNQMPSYEVLLRSAQRADLMAFLKTLVEAKPSESEGEAVFRQCSGCHSADSEKVKTGPDLKGLFGREKLFNGKPVNEATVRSLIEEGSGKGMPGFKSAIPEPAMQALIGYLKSL